MAKKVTHKESSDCDIMKPENDIIKPTTSKASRKVSEPEYNTSAESTTSKSSHKFTDRKESPHDDILEPYSDPKRPYIQPQPVRIMKPKEGKPGRGTETEKKKPKIQREPTYKNPIKNSTLTKPTKDEYLIGHIILSPAKESVTGPVSSKQDEIKNTVEKDIAPTNMVGQPKPFKSKTQPSTGTVASRSKIDFRKSLQQIKDQKAIQRVRSALSKTQFRAKREYIKSQLNRIAKMKRSNGPKISSTPKSEK